MATVTPMMQQYLDMKHKYEDCILFFRLGDFYEMFFEDAKLVSKELELTLTGKDCGLSERAPMCGVPYHAASGYISRLIEKGYCADLSQNADIMEKVSAMYPEVVEPLMVDGKLYGVPVGMSGTCYGVNMELWESLGLTEDA